MEQPARVRRASLLLLPLVYLGYISLGMPDGTLGVAWPEVYPELGLPVGMAGTLTLVGTLLTALAGFNAGRIIARFRTGPVITVSCAMTGTALLLISRANGLPVLFGAAVLLGLGAGAVDAGLNAFVARHYSGRHMNWLHACWGLGAMCGPLVMGWMMATGPGWRGGYLIIGLAQATLAVVFFFTLGLWSAAPEREVESSHDAPGKRVPSLRANSFEGFLSAGVFALYVAGEGTLGLWAATVMVVDKAIAVPVAAVCAAGLYGAIMAGRVATGVIVDRLGNRTMVRFGMVIALAGAVIFAISDSPVPAGCALMLVGLGLSPVYPCLMHEVPRRFAPDAIMTVIGRQSGAASLGAAAMPALAGLVAQKSVAAVPWLVVGTIAVLIISIRELDRRS